MTTTRRNFLGLALLGVGSAAIGCGNAIGSAGPTNTLRYQGWAGDVILPELAADLGFLGDVKLEWVGNTISGPQDIQSAATGQVDFGGAFNGAVVKLKAAGAPIKSVISYYGADADAYSGFFVAEHSPIKTARDLLGKKVGMNTLGAHHEAMLGIYLKRNGLTPEEIKRVEPIVVPPPNTEQSLRQKQIEVGVLGGIWRDKALERGGVRKLFSDFDLLGAFSAGTYVFTERFLKQNPNTVRAFVSGVARTIEWSRATPRQQVVERKAEIIKRRGRNEDAAAIRYWKSNGVAGPGGRIQESELALWADWLAERGEVERGRIKIADLYTNEFNDLAKG
ncbi:ABC-type nitrate/sulfonate/bicarbonate transport system substrate-binding protein [Herbihabitans rhizosphaerae]|uniref:ABC-type nitrate/sulfonate/bicarbonate transport system substrate-binding protein n=1 Tax=Herbihabitans rhizosphaerae TaxID=1872711 RepID=A0A4Q7L5H4_9PSEU|nr:ABC transporter substrate-binding protein [Herbihabitans rhizosphaerae]RZS43512.1 ABC-type nitrate/sulfonate/bicarbonate transport system substrate-binding protein [Herbihabitans rhizosphaerae]